MCIYLFASLKASQKMNPSLARHSVPVPPVRSVGCRGVGNGFFPGTRGYFSISLLAAKVDI